MDANAKLEREAPPIYRVLAIVCSVLSAPFVRIHVHRTDVATRHQTGIVIANHRSFFDAIMGLVAFHRIRRYPRVVCAAEYFDRRFVGFFLRSAGAVPVDRDNGGTLDDAAARVLAAGIPIIILPEGKLSGVPGEPTSMGTFKTGAARMAHSQGVPIWALAHVGCDDVWPRARKFPRLRPFRRWDVHLLGGAEIIWTTGDALADTERLEAAVRELLVENVTRYSTTN